MVQVEEVPEETLFAGGREGETFESDSADGFDSDGESEFDDYIAEETVYDRIVALKDIVPPQTRSRLIVTYSKSRSWVQWGIGQAGNIAWIVSTSALLVGLPLALAIEDETRITQQEREMQMQSQGQQQVSWSWGPFAHS